MIDLFISFASAERVRVVETSRSRFERKSPENDCQAFNSASRQGKGHLPF